MTGTILNRAKMHRAMNALYRGAIGYPAIFERTPRPMHINITIRGIANGFIVEANSGPCYDDGATPGGVFYPTFADAAAALDRTATDALERSRLAEQRDKELCIAKQREYRTGYSEDAKMAQPDVYPSHVASGFTIGEGFGGRTSFPNQQDREDEPERSKLPEEQAASGENQPPVVPLTDED